MDSLLRFESTIKSEITKRNYKVSLDLFKKFIHAKDYDSMLSIPNGKIQELVEEYVIHLKDTKNPNSIKALFFGVKHFFVMNRVRLDWEIISKMFPETRKTTGDKAWTTKHVQLMLDNAKSKRNRALIPFPLFVHTLPTDIGKKAIPSNYLQITWLFFAIIICDSFTVYTEILNS